MRSSWWSAALSVAGIAAVGMALSDDRAKFSLHKYLGAAGNYVTVSSSDGRHAVQFETRHGRVFRYRAGKFPEVVLVEGCN